MIPKTILSRITSPEATCALCGTRTTAFIRKIAFLDGSILDPLQNPLAIHEVCAPCEQRLVKASLKTVNIH